MSQRIRSHRSTSRSTSRRSTSKNSPSLSAYKTPKTSPSPKIKYREITASLEKEFEELLEKQRLSHIETHSAKNRRELSEKRRKEKVDEKWNKFEEETKAYHRIEKQKKMQNKKSVFKRFKNLFKGGGNQKTKKHNK
jgi:hypothetical protein